MNRSLAGAAGDGDATGTVPASLLALRFWALTNVDVAGGARSVAVGPAAPSRPCHGLAV